MKKKITICIITLLLFALTFNSCTVKKRLYNPGYQVQWSKSSKSNKKKKNDYQYKQKEYPTADIVQITPRNNQERQKTNKQLEVIPKVQPKAIYQDVNTPEILVETKSAIPPKTETFAENNEILPKTVSTTNNSIIEETIKELKDITSYFGIDPESPKQKEQNPKSNHVGRILSTIGVALGLLAIAVLVYASIFAMTTQATLAAAAILLLELLILSINIAIAGLVLSIIGFKMSLKNDDKTIVKLIGIIGIILGLIPILMIVIPLLFP